MFGGAYSGDYDMWVRHKTEGLVGSSSIPLNVGATVTNVSPKISSIYGGTVITITGTNFGTTKTDNPVSIFQNGFGNTVPCHVLTTAPTQITCQVDDTITKTDSDVGEVIVFLKTSEEAPCIPTTVCKTFTYSSSVPIVTSQTRSFDSTDNRWELIVAGTQFPTTTSEATLTVGGVQQPTKSITAT